MTALLWFWLGGFTAALVPLAARRKSDTPLVLWALGALLMSSAWFIAIPAGLIMTRRRPLMIVISRLGEGWWATVDERRELARFVRFRGSFPGFSGRAGFRDCEKARACAMAFARSRNREAEIIE